MNSESQGAPLSWGASCKTLGTVVSLNVSDMDAWGLPLTTEGIRQALHRLLSLIPLAAVHALVVHNFSAPDESGNFDIQISW